MFISELSQEERAIIIAYRHMNEEEKGIILKAMGLKEKADIVHFPKHRPEGAEQDPEPPINKTLIIPISNE